MKYSLEELEKNLKELQSTEVRTINDVRVERQFNLMTGAQGHKNFDRAITLQYSIRILSKRVKGGFVTSDEFRSTVKMLESKDDETYELGKSIYKTLVDRAYNK